MTHTSSYRYGAPMLEPAAECRRSSDVRVRYFDPVTGEPCEGKPKPLRKQRQELTAEQKRLQREEAEAEAAEIMENMRKRKRGKNSFGSRGKRNREVLVDGVLFESVALAAVEIGTSPQHLGKAISAGKEYVKGRRVAFAEVVR